MSDDSRNRSQKILDEIFASEQFLEIERGWAEQAKREAARRRAPKRPLLTAGISSRRPDINMADLREHGTYRGKP